MIKGKKAKIVFTLLEKLCLIKLKIIRHIPISVLSVKITLWVLYRKTKN